MGSWRTILVFRSWWFVRSSNGSLFRCSYQGSSVFRSPFGYRIGIQTTRSALQMPGNVVPGNWMANHLNTEQVKVCYWDVSAIQMCNFYSKTLFQESERVKIVLSNLLMDPYFSCCLSYHLIVLFPVLFVFSCLLLLGFNLRIIFVGIRFKSCNKTPEKVVQAGRLAHTSKEPVQSLHGKCSAGSLP